LQGTQFENADGCDLIRYRMQHERYVRRVAEAVLPTRFAISAYAYASDVDHDQHVALVRGDLEARTGPGARPFPLLTATSSAPPRATAANSSRVRWKPSPRKIAACFSTSITRDAASPVETAEEPGALPQIHFHRRGQLDREPAVSAWSSTKAASARRSDHLGLKDIRSSPTTEKVVPSRLWHPHRRPGPPAHRNTKPSHKPYDSSHYIHVDHSEPPGGQSFWLVARSASCHSERSEESLLWFAWRLFL